MARQQQVTRGLALLDTPTLNKGTAFTPEERRDYGLEGLLPPAVESLDRQLERVLQHLDAKPNDLERYIYLIGLWWFIPGMALAIAYSVFTYRHFAGKVD